MAIFLQGALRDTRAGDPVIRIDFSSAPHSGESPFRVWGHQTYDLLISSVNHNTSAVGQSLGAEFEVEVVDPDGKAVLHRTFPPGTTGHRVPSNYGDVTLATLKLNGSPLQSWTLRVNVLKPDPTFRTAQTQLKLYKRQYDPGMGGLMNYAIMIPGGILMVVAFALAVSLARGGSRLPLLLTASAASLIVLIPQLLS